MNLVSHPRGIEAHSARGNFPSRFIAGSGFPLVHTIPQVRQDPPRDRVQPLHGSFSCSPTGARHAEQKLPDFRSNQSTYGVE